MANAVPNWNFRDAPDLIDVEGVAGNVRRIVRRLHRKSVLRTVTESVLAGQTVPCVEILNIASVIAPDPRRKERERLVAIWLLGSLCEPEEIERQASSVILSTLRNNSTAYRRRRLPRINLSSLSGRKIAEASPWMVFVIPVMMLRVPLIVLSPIVWEIRERRRNRLLSMAFVSAARLRIAEAIDYVVPAANDNGTGLRASNWLEPRNMAWRCLPTIASSLTPAHYGRLSTETVPGLCRTFRNAGPGFSLAILNGLAAVGDSRAIPTVKRLAKRNPEPGVQARASEVLAILEERKRAEEAAGVLLRPAEDIGDASETLLRAATSTSDTPPEQLLRASLRNATDANGDTK